MNTEIVKVAIVYQAHPLPAKDGIVKPMKPGGYADSGADIAYALKQHNNTVITPSDNPYIDKDADWVFPDTDAGIRHAIQKGANCIWLNTTLYAEHPVSTYLNRGISVVGQLPLLSELYDDKWTTNHLLKDNGLPIPEAILIHYKEFKNHPLQFPLPAVAKPIRGRGSEGVSLVKTEAEYQSVMEQLFQTDRYGTTVYLESYLPGEEITITVMPPGHYIIHGKDVEKPTPWCLPAVRRFNHQNGIAPYSGTVAVNHNSAVLNDHEETSMPVQQLYEQCVEAAKLVGLRAPIRIDCRQDKAGNYLLFDLNMKPNMTGAARPHRHDQDSLTALAARKIGWSFTDLLENMLAQRWHN
ncbi:D-alanine-D-alanine ligase [Chitinophaga jiangningensis]|uniref:D-alanine-D-alanine ligase n=1 Tax=Chitinophaga jiangningensis TaxID=1419482 RepID=A0A1M7CYE8_9BACT|nr:ATP-grasp domain-containing protein [Chitinophaga jiangningensis]SHL72308.1 D-alanine-D-alanine ligase [Chitinophaga jiangningensis]